ncbi:MAG: cytochrome c3 family protein, partial [Planctomycetota bacterium]
AAPTPEPMKRYLTGNEEIPWLQFQLAPRHVFFSHRRHVSIAGLECTVCHGDMSRRALPVTEPDFPRRLWGMNRCVECHLEEEVSTDCLACHH